MSKTTKPTPETASKPVKEQAKPVLSIIKDIQRQTRKQYSAEEKNTNESVQIHLF